MGRKRNTKSKFRNKDTLMILNIISPLQGLNTKKINIKKGVKIIWKSGKSIII